MQPLGHALSVFVPGYGYWQVYRHFALIASLLERLGASTKVDPFSATIGVVLWSLTFLHYSTEPIFVALDMIELLAATGVVVYGQRALNQYWRARPGPSVEERVLPMDWIAMSPPCAMLDQMVKEMRLRCRSGSREASKRKTPSVA